MRHRSTPIAAALVCLAALAGATACGTDAPASTAAAATSTASAAEVTARLDAALAQFPSTPPATVVTASVPLAEVLTLLGVPVAGVPSTTTQQLPTTLDAVPRIGTVKALDVEKIVSLDPDLVVAAEGAREAVAATLTSTGTPGAYLDTESFGDLRFAVQVLGEAFDRQDRATEVLSTMDTHATHLAESGTPGKAPKVLVLIGAADSFMVMNNNTFLGSLIQLAGADNVADSALGATETFSAVNLENIIAAAPDVVLVLRSGDVAAGQAAFDAEVAKNPAWTNLPAHANDRIHVLDYATFGYTSVAGLDRAVPTLAGALDL
ncbi:ABC transporter substrate-binding protein [Rhodococcus spelaei]|uniref:ABC transporter substrate-binding protein n=1 Tax=Rhodococcus spelaei TaxID=2546320 RepID=A0A541BQR0_9NOCA|nr:ABC transporter substrate-binding protein [Rhodococcus spelaei]TQF74660.1 ABC transporter substrate-binding protein [Rhodococcus spelaei]